MRDDDLDRALARYSSKEPLAGLEQRVLHRIRAEGAASRFGFGQWVWAIGVALVACIIAAGVWLQKPVPQRTAARRMEGGLQPARGLSPAIGERRLSRRQARRPVLLTPEERALLTLVTSAPNPASEALLDLQRRSREPIQFEPIEIEPLRSHDANDDAK
jgi:hypothetical protein